MAQPTFSIVIPSYNEGDDIRLSIESALRQSVHPLEILVVDDSNDKTPDIINAYKSRGVRLVKGERKGCCGARNIGMRLAKGDVVVLLNGDVMLPPDFFENTAPHYEAGADYVLVESRVSNCNDAFARFIEVQHRLEYGNRTDLEWTEGFSARRQALEAVGYIPGEFSARFCRDWMLGKNLGKAGYRKVVDKSIVVTHKAPAQFAEYWRVRKDRGRFSSLTQYYIYAKNRRYLVPKFAIKHLVAAIKLATLIVPALRAAKLAALSRQRGDFFVFLYAHYIQEVARMWGEWQGLLTLR